MLKSLMPFSCIEDGDMSLKRERARTTRALSPIKHTLTINQHKIYSNNRAKLYMAPLMLS